MALTPEEQAELEQLKIQEETLRANQDTLVKQLEALRAEQEPAAPQGYVAETSPLEAGVRSFAQGLLSEHADEVSAAMSTLFSGKALSSPRETYNKKLEEERQEFKLAEESYPKLSLLGGIAGGVAQGVGLGAITGGAGTAASLASKGKELNKLQKALKYVAPTMEKGKALENIAKTAIAGGIIGGVSQYGASEKGPIEALGEVPFGVASGAAVGGALSGLVEGGKKVVGTAADYLEEQAKAGKLTYDLRKILDVIKSGKTKQGYFTEDALKQIDADFNRGTGEAVDLLENSIGETNKLKEVIINQFASNPVGQVQNIINTLAKFLSKEAAQSTSNANDALNALLRVIPLESSYVNGSLGAKETNNIIRAMEDFIYKNKKGIELDSTVRAGIKDALADLKTNLRISIDESEIDDFFKNLPEDASGLKQAYEKYMATRDANLEALKSPVVSPVEKTGNLQVIEGGAIPSTEQTKPKLKILTPQEAEESASRIAAKQIELRDDLDKIIELSDQLELKRKDRTVDLSRKNIEKQISDLWDKVSQQLDIEDKTFSKDVLLKAKDKLRQIQVKEAAASPLARLDTATHNILNASEDLGGILEGGGDGVAKTFPILDIMRGVNLGSTSGIKYDLRYASAVDNLSKANKDLGNSFKKILDPRILKLENKRFIEGSRLGEAPSKGAMGTFSVDNALRKTAIVGNVYQQGILSVKPVVSLLSTMAKVVDEKLKITPQSPSLKFFSEALKNAIDAKDEGRRVAILNTLSQYKTFRELFKTED